MITVNGMPLEEYMRHEGLTDDEIIQILQEGLRKRRQLKNKMHQEQLKQSGMSDKAISLYQHYKTIPEELPCDTSLNTRVKYTLDTHASIIRERCEGWKEAHRVDALVFLKRYLEELGIHPDIAYLINAPTEDIAKTKLRSMATWRDNVGMAGGLKIDNHTLDRKMSRYLIRKSMQDIARKEYCSNTIDGLHENAVLAYILLDNIL